MNKKSQTVVVIYDRKWGLVLSTKLWHSLFKLNNHSNIALESTYIWYIRERFFCVLFWFKHKIWILEKEWTLNFPLDYVRRGFRNPSYKKISSKGGDCTSWIFPKHNSTLSGLFRKVDCKIWFWISYSNHILAVNFPKQTRPHIKWSSIQMSMSITPANHWLNLNI